jgi:anthranilate/para-aminobenzoate synthase component I
MIRPSRARFLMAERPEPLALTVGPPSADAFDLYRRLRVRDRPSFLLESGIRRGKTARYSYLGSDPYLILRGAGDTYELQTRDGTTQHTGGAFEALTGLLRRSPLLRAEGLPPFFGGAVGYFSYDLVRRFETLPVRAAADEAWPDLHFLFVDLVAALDHETGCLHLLFAPPLERLLGESREKLYREGCDRLAEMEVRLTAARPLADGHPGRAVPVELRPNLSRRDNMERVTLCKNYIAAGDIYQANLSHRFAVSLDPGLPGDTHGTTVALYASLRRVNPSPFSALLEFGDINLLSSSPERLVRLQGRTAETRPIAGTRPRGADLADDRHLAEELITNPKERAEHLMLVDLERNDLGRVCRYGSVRADELMIIERYSHVSHLVSNIVGTLRDGLDGFDLIRAMFPGGTITGVPKIHCMELIETLEPVRRGPYTGSLGYISWSGDLDFNIIIRTLILKGTRGYVQVGAGIVADSDPSREYDETLYKAEALMEALQGM